MLKRVPLLYYTELDKTNWVPWANKSIRHVLNYCIHIGRQRVQLV